MSSHLSRPLRPTPGNGQEPVSREPAVTPQRLSVRRRPAVSRPITSLPDSLDYEPTVDSLSRLRDEVDALARRYVLAASEATIEREAFLYSLHPGKHLVPFYLWLSIRGYGTFAREAG